MRRQPPNARMLVPLLVGVPGCLAAGWFELTRALDGRTVAWIYAFEWPLYAVLGVFMWWRIWHRQPAEPARVPQQSAPADAAVEDLELVAWQQYLAQLHAADPPGGPPRP
jgi:hypothetical protein